MRPSLFLVPQTYVNPPPPTELDEEETRFVIKARPGAGEVAAVYTKDAMTMELVVVPSSVHPLKSVEVCIVEALPFACPFGRRKPVGCLLSDRSGGIAVAATARQHQHVLPHITPRRTLIAGRYWIGSL